MLYRREKYLKKIRPFYCADDIIKVITGLRRCGKSCLMEMIKEELLEQGIPEESIVFIDLDKHGYRRIKDADSLEELLESRIPEERKSLLYLFIDEIQNVKDFEEVINGYRTEGGISIFITGSNSYLLSGELVTKLTGRYLEFEMFPLTFEEYVEMKKFYSIPVNPNLSLELNRYILEGGFPRTVLLDSMEAKRTYVSGVVSEIFEKDIRRRVKIKDRSAFEAVRTYVLNNYGATTSLNALTEALNRNGINITRATVSKYIKVLLDAKILYECNRFDMKSRRSLAGEKKYYLGDLSFYFSLNTDNRINYGPSLENIVYLYACSHGFRISVGRFGKLECDFILRRSTDSYSYVQVAYTILQSRETEDREYRVLEAIKDNYPKYVVTTDYLEQKRNGILHVNLMEFMLNNGVF